MGKIDNSLERKNNVERFDQSPLPVYPNFEATKTSMQLGQIGWGMDKASILNSP